MALHFGKRENETLGKPQNASTATPRYGAAATPVGTATATEAPPVSASAAQTSPSPNSSAEGSGSKLTVGPNIKLKGVEITDCDTLFVEGLVEATMDSRVIQIAEQGAFKGTAEIDIAEIRGSFDGHLTVRQKLVIYATGRVTGTIRYGKVVIEEGGQLSGDIECSVAPAASSSAAHASTNASTQAANKPAMVLAA